jgi:hypothetical protein
MAFRVIPYVSPLRYVIRHFFSKNSHCGCRLRFDQLHFSLRRPFDRPLPTRYLLSAYGCSVPQGAMTLGVTCYCVSILVLFLVDISRISTHPVSFLRVVFLGVLFIAVTIPEALDRRADHRRQTNAFTFPSFTSRALLGIVLAS